GIVHQPSNTSIPTDLEIDLSVLHAMLEKHNGPLIVWDIGLGAAAPALAAILAYESIAEKQSSRPMQVYSFSEDLSPLRLALHHKKRFGYLRHGAADTLLHRGRWTSRYCPGLSWELNAVNPPTPHLILHAPLPGTEKQQLPEGALVLRIRPNR
ncbi:MAG: hypothetical protein LDL31_09930, partial [Prosthecobacter sp.]|nr:hypothetical protein [Prosthecobacter sp.]